MGGKRVALGPAPFRTSASALLVLLVVGGLVRGDGLLDILERQGELVRVELLRPAAELHALQLMQEMLQAIVAGESLVARRDRGVALGERGRELRLQLGDVHWRLIRALAHDRKRITSAHRRDPENDLLIQLVTPL